MPSVAGPTNERVVDFDDGVGQIRVGRRADLELSLPFSPLSGVHARLVRASDSDKKVDHWVLEDLGSTNGTYVGGERLKPGTKLPLKAGTEIKLASIKVIFDGDVRVMTENGTEIQPVELLNRKTGKVQVEAPNRATTSKVLADAANKASGQVQAEAPNKATGKTVSEVSSKPRIPSEGSSSKSDVKVPPTEPTATYVRGKHTDIVAPGPSAAPYLKAVAGITEGDTTFRLEQRDHEYMFGRTRRCDFRVNVNEVSREHASFTRRSDGVYVNDLGSVNGVLVNNTRVKEYRLYDGDLVQIGHVKLRLFDANGMRPRESERSTHSLSASALSQSHSALSQSHSPISQSPMSSAPAAPAPPSRLAMASGAALPPPPKHPHLERSALFGGGGGAGAGEELHPAIAGALAADGGGGEYRPRRPSVRVRLAETWGASNRLRYVVVIVAASLLAFVAVMVGFRLAG